MVEQKLSDALRTHRQSLDELTAQVDAVLQSDVERENRTLKEQLAAAQAWRTEAEQRVTSLEQENRNLRGTLYDHLFNERTSLVNSAQQRVNTYYGAQMAGGLNRLAALEYSMRQRADALRAALNQNQSQQVAELVGELYALENRARQAIAEARAAYTPVAGAFTEQESAEFEALRSETLTKEQISEAARKTNLEVFIGKNLINKAGVLLVVIGVIAAAQYTLLRLPDVFKGAAFFLLGALMLLGGELMNRRKPTVFSLGITAGGVAVLYTAMSVSYFVLGILGTVPAIVVCVLITAASFFLSVRYSSQTIATFAMLGGYLPILAIGNNSTMLYGSMAYFAVLSLLALLLSTQKRWRICTFTGFVLNLGASCYIAAGAVTLLRPGIFDMPILWMFSPMRFNRPGPAVPPFGAAQTLLLLYLFFSFLIYTAIPIIGALRQKQPLAPSELVLLSLNTVASSVILYSVFVTLGFSNLSGLLAILFAVIYLALGRFLEARFQADKKACMLFYLTGLTFVVLVVPFQFGTTWLSLGWLVEGVILTVYGILRNDRFTKTAGAVICGLCLGAFLLMDIIGIGAGYHMLFAWKYLAITLGSAAVYAALVRVKAHGEGVSIYKIFAAINAWGYLLYLCSKVCNYALRAQLYEYRFILFCLFAIATTVLLAYAYAHVRALAEPGLAVLGVVMNFAACAGLLLMNQLARPAVYSESIALSVAALVLANLAGVFAMREALMHLILRKAVGIQLFPLLLSAFFLLLTTQVMLEQFYLSFSSIILSALYMAAAIAWVVLGFAKRYSYLRRFGLALALFSIVKLFLVDLFALTQGYRIVLYFALGVSLIAISFVYQYFSKKYVDKGAETPHE